MAVTCGCTRQPQFQHWMEILQKGHEAYVLAEKRLGDKYKFAVRAMPYDARIGALEQRKGYFGNRQNEVASMGKFGTPAPKTMENTRLSLEGKRSIGSLLKEHGPYSTLITFQFTSVTNLRTKGMFGVYNRDQVVPSALEFKYLSS